MALTELEQALAQARSRDVSLRSVLNEIEQDTFTSSGEVDGLVVALDADGYHPPPADDVDPLMNSVMYVVCGLMQDNEKVPNDYIRSQLAPRVLRLLDHHMEHRDVDVSDVLFAVKVLSLYGDADVVARIGRLARDPWSAGGFLWSVLLEIYADDEHPHTAALVTTLQDPLPTGFAAIAFLDLVNTLARESGLVPHPFDSPAGQDRLRTWLSSAKADEESYAVSTTAALPFISAPARQELLDLAMIHRSPEVRLEAAWVSAKLGEGSGVQRLAEAAYDVNLSQRAVAYMSELGLDDHIPARARSPEFVARSEMASWLAHPMEFGRPPASIDLFDQRELHWPPTDDRRTVYLFRYLYDDDEPDEGVGMVGSITFALFGEATVDRSAAEIYALHCVWELQQQDDPRAPADRTVEAGLRLLHQANPTMLEFST